MKLLVVFFAAALAVLLDADSSPVTAQTFQSFTCADGASFTAAFLKYDPKQVHLATRRQGCRVEEAVHADGFTLHRPRHHADDEQVRHHSAARQARADPMHQTGIAA